MKNCKRVVFLLVILMVLLMPVFAIADYQATQYYPSGIPSIEKMKPNGEYNIHVLSEGKWQNAGTLSFDKYFRERALDLKDYISVDKDVKVKLIQKGGGAAHIDAVLLGGTPPIKVEGVENGVKKLSKEDFDVADAFGKEILVAFPKKAKDTKLRLSARAEQTAISKTPFQFPTDNLYKTMNTNSKFYTYKMGSNNNLSPIFKEYSVTGSGHPSGYTSGFVRNDGENLYVKIDFAPDNTMDGDKDFAKVYVKTKAGLREFKVSVPETKWGKSDFTYTDSVSYEHKVYDFKIPFKELGIEDEGRERELLVAFAAYGTATPVPPQVIYNNFGENNSCNREYSFSVSNDTGSIWTFATSFTPIVSGFVSDIWAGIGSLTGDNAMAVALMTDDSNKPGSVLEEWDFRGQMVSAQSEPFTPLHGVGAGTTEISAGTKYWIAATIPADATGDHSWLSSFSFTGLVADKNSQGFTGEGWINRGYFVQPAFRVSAYIIDNCPADPDKTEPGACGCGTPDTDSDGDGDEDCIDGCPADPYKTEPGACGCGNVETVDSDYDGTPDCIDGCPNDRDKTAPGACGCGIADFDSDEDDIIDCNDNCPYYYNPDQKDVNGNGTGDICDNLPDLTGSWSSLKFNTKNSTCSGRLKINNAGNVNAVTFQVAYYLLDNATDPLSTPVVTETITGVRAGRSVSGTFKYQSTTSLTGKYVIAVIDSTEKIVERIEDNNRASRQIQ